MTLPAPVAPALLLVGTSDEARVEGALGALGLAAECAIDADLFEAGPRPVVVVDPDVLGPDPEAGIAHIVAQTGGAPLVFLSGPPPGWRRLAQLLGERSMRALVARDHVTSDEELRHALSCVCGGPRFGWEGLMTPEAAEVRRSVTASGERDACLEEVATFLSQARVRGRIVRLVQDVVDELVTNALYDAPVDSAGAPLYADRDRRLAVTLPAPARPTLRVARDPSHVAVSMTDPHGSLTADTVRYYLSKGLRRGAAQVDNKAGGAGLGLTRIYESVDRMTVKVLAGARTEVMAMIELGGARGDIASRPPGLILAFGEPEGPCGSSARS